MKKQWQSMSEHQVKRFAEFASRKHLVGMLFNLFHTLIKKISQKACTAKVVVSAVNS